MAVVGKYYKEYPYTNHMKHIHQITQCSIHLHSSWSSFSFWFYTPSIKVIAYFFKKLIKDVYVSNLEYSRAPHAMSITRWSGNPSYFNTLNFIFYFSANSVTLINYKMHYQAPGDFKWYKFRLRINQYINLFSCTLWGTAIHGDTVILHDSYGHSF